MLRDPLRVLRSAAATSEPTQSQGNPKPQQEYPSDVVKLYHSLVLDGALANRVRKGVLYVSFPPSLLAQRRWSRQRQTSLLWQPLEKPRRYFTRLQKRLYSGPKARKDAEHDKKSRSDFSWTQPENTTTLRDRARGARKPSCVV